MKGPYKQFIKLLQIPSVSSDSSAVNNALEHVIYFFEDISDFIKVHTFTCNSRRSILITPEKYSPSKLKIILNGHVDVVDAPIELFSPKVVDGKIYARGAYDMKGGLFAGMLAYKKLISQNPYLPIGLQVVPDEEIGGFDGTLCQLKKGVRAEFMVALEPSNLDIAIAAKGVLWLEVIAKGKAAHAAYPWNGMNALEELVDFINALKRNFPNPSKHSWQTTYNLAYLNTPNKTLNQIPDKAVLKVDIRYIPQDRSRLEKFLSDQKDKLPIDLKYLMFEPSFNTSVNNEYIKALANILKKYKPDFKYVKRDGSSDVRHFARYGISGIEFGPVGYGSHQTDEYVEWPSITKLAEILEEWITQILS